MGFACIHLISLVCGFLCSVGGAAITCKNELETINEENLKEVSAQLSQSMAMGLPSGRILGMDWSKQAGESDNPYSIDGFRDQLSVELNPFIVVHGAGQSHSIHELELPKFKISIL